MYICNKMTGSIKANVKRLKAKVMNKKNIHQLLIMHYELCIMN